MAVCVWGHTLEIRLPSCKMSGIELVGLMLASGDALLKKYASFHQRVEDGRNELSLLRSEPEKRVERMCACVKRYSLGVNKESIPVNVLKKAVSEFDAIRYEMEMLLSAPKRSGWYFPEHVENVRKSNENLRALEHQLDISGLITHQNISMHEQLDNLTQAVREIPAAQNDSTIRKVVDTIDSTLDSSARKGDDVDIVPVQALNLLNALAKSGLPAGEKMRLSNMARNVWEGWKVNINDIEFVRKRNGDRKRIGKGGAADVYLAHMKLRDRNDEVIPGDTMKVAVKEFVVKSAEADDEFTQFIREIFLQKEAQHPCIVRTLGGYWPEQAEAEAFIVMERMSSNLRQVLDKNLLDTLEAKRLVLADIAAGIEHLHSLRIVHRDIKPENVLLRVRDKRIIGRAKVSDFSVSRKAKDTVMLTTSLRTSSGIAATFPYMPPESFSDSAHQSSLPARDIWSFGVLMCAVLAPDFIKNAVRGHPEGLHVMAMKGKLAKLIVESAKRISCDRVLEGIAISCLSLDPKLRPRIEDISHQLRNDEPLHQFHFVNFLSREYRVNEVLRYARKHFAVEAQTSNLASAVAALMEASFENANVSVLIVLGYCHYFGIGVEQDVNKSVKFLQRGCYSGDTTAMFSLGVVHYQAGKVAHAAALLRSSSDAGCTGAMIWMAHCYRFGYGVQKNEEKSFQLTSSAADAGNQNAQASLASYFRSGIGTVKDEKRGVALLYGLSASGNGFASMELALWYKQGHGVPKDEEKSEHFLELARKRGIDGTWVFNEERNVWYISKNEKSGSSDNETPANRDPSSA